MEKNMPNAGTGDEQIDDMLKDADAALRDKLGVPKDEEDTTSGSSE